jgi:hypothetical protein
MNFFATLAIWNVCEVKKTIFPFPAFSLSLFDQEKRESGVETSPLVLQMPIYKWFMLINPVLRVYQRTEM